MASYRFYRSNLRFFAVAAFIGMIFTLEQLEAKSTDDLSDFPRRFFLPGLSGKDYQIKLADILSSSFKRNPNEEEEEFGRDLLQYFSEEQVNAATRAEYKVVPHPLVYTSQILHEGVNCSSIRTNLHKNHVKPELRLRPDWIHKSQYIGDCPTHYVARELPPMYSPAVIMEAVCTCGGSQCSRSGHQCVPVTRHVPVWLRRGPNFHVLDIEELTVACVCVRRPSGDANYIFEAAIQS